MTYLWSDLLLNDELAAAFAWYSEYFPADASGTFSASANQLAVVLGATALSVDAVTLGGVTCPQVPDRETLYEPAVRSGPSQTYVQPVVPYGVAASHGQAWAFFNQSVNFRYGLALATAVVVYYRVLHALPSDDVTNVTPPDNDVPMIVLYACDRLVQSAHTDAVRRGAPGAWADARQDRGYAQRWRAELAARLRHGHFGTMMPLQ